MTDISRPRKAEPFENEPFTHDLVALLRECVDPAWYLETYPDVAAAGLDAVEHFTRFGARERRDPNRWFNSEWYAAVHSEVLIPLGTWTYFAGSRPRVTRCRSA